VSAKKICKVTEALWHFSL